MIGSPFRVLPIGRRLPLLDAEATRVLEGTVRALPAGTLMRRAGVAIARLALALAPHAERIWIAAGPGNNGGDAIEAAMRLIEAGREVEVALIGDPSRFPPDATAALARARAAGVAIDERPVPRRAPDLAIDGLLGAGASRPPSGALADAIRALASVHVPVLAIDLPSGLDPRSGRALGTAQVRADHTLALLTLKPGLVTGEGRDLAGTLWLDTLGVDGRFGDTDRPPTAWLRGVEPGAVRPRRPTQHKGSFGDVAVVGGAPGMAGAALLAARAAHAAGAGRVFVDRLDRPPAWARLDPFRPELMFRDRWAETAADEALGRTTVVCGCGGGDEAVAGVLPRLLSATRRLVLDADALNAIARDPALAAALRARRGAGRASVVTPHPLEAARLLGTTAAGVQADRLAAAAGLVARYDCIVVLKGSGSIVAAPGEVPSINATGNAALATAGTGDVLAGWIGGRWAGGNSSGDDDSGVADFVCRAVAEHGAAAEPAPSGPLRAADLVERLYRM